MFIICMHNNMLYIMREFDVNISKHGISIYLDVHARLYMYNFTIEYNVSMIILWY